MKRNTCKSITTIHAVSSFCIRVQGPKIWNSIPQDIKDCKLNDFLITLIYWYSHWCNYVNITNYVHMYNYCVEYVCYECIVTHEWENKQIMLQFQLPCTYSLFCLVINNIVQIYQKLDLHLLANATNIWNKKPAIFSSPKRHLRHLKCLLK